MKLKPEIAIKIQLKKAKAVELELFEQYIGKNILFRHKRYGPIYGRLLKNGKDWIELSAAKNMSGSEISDIVKRCDCDKATVMKGWKNIDTCSDDLPKGIYNKNDIGEVYKINLKFFS